MQVVIWTPHFALGALMMAAWVVVARVAYVLVNIWFGGPTVVTKEGIKTLVVLGSGGHTTEMLKLSQSLQSKHYKPIIYVVADSDVLSRAKLENLFMRTEEKGQTKNVPSDEKKTNDDSADVELVDGTNTVQSRYNLRKRTTSNSFHVNGKHSDPPKSPDIPPPPMHKLIIESIPRSRDVGQSYFTSIFTTLRATAYSFIVVLRHRPDLILVNGPGSCVPICVSGLVLRILGACNGRITFVESLCRVKTLSLSGKLLYWITDDFLVQWPELKEKYPKSQYLGRLV